MSRAGAQPGLEVDGLRIVYGGNVAVESATFSAPLGRVTGLIGPNGAGKTSIFNACDGLVPAAAGTVRLQGTDVTRTGTSKRARLGLGRTFQIIEVCNSMDVRANVALGAQARRAGSNPLRQVLPGREGRTAIAAATAEALELCDLAPLADRLVSTLTGGQRRLVELARVVAAGFAVLLLDEPSSGLDDDETARLGEILLQLADDRGVGILLVEHDMALVMSVCEHLHVLDFGTVVFEGSPAEVQASDVVRTAYLGQSAEVVG